MTIRFSDIMTVSLRPPTRPDYDVIASWIPNASACLRWAGPLVPFPFSASKLPELLAVADSESYCLGEANNNPQGFGQIWLRDGDAVRLMRIIVSPDTRGQGLGRELCRQLISRAVEAEGGKSINLAVYRDNTAALRLYQSLGFLPVDARCTAELLFMTLVPDKVI